MALGLAGWRSWPRNCGIPEVPALAALPTLISLKLPLLLSVSAYSTFAWLSSQMISGKFVPYSTTELNARYPTHAAYVQAVTTAADAALAAGWILASDRDAYVATAQACLVGTGVPLTYAQILECFRR